MMKYHKNLLKFTRSLWLVLGMFVIFAITFGFYVYSEKQIDRANESRLQSFLLTDELRQSSDDLTNMVRSYVVTGSPLYKQHYLEILNIRDGKTPRPVDYYDIYWDLVLANDQRPRPKEQAIALLALMQQANFTEAEFAKLTQAKNNSDQLTHAEFNAMALIEANNPTTTENRHKALVLLFSPSYFQAKASIMQPISELNLMMRQRTLEAVYAAKNTAALLRVLFILFGLLLMLSLFFAYRGLYAVLGCSVDQLQKCITHFGSKDFSCANSIPKEIKNSVLGWLLEKQISLSRIEAEREQARLAQQEALERLQKIASSVPGMVYQFRLNPDGTACFPYTSPAIQDIYHVTPEEVKNDAAKVFSLIHSEDYDDIVSSIKTSAQDLTPWQQEYRVTFENGSEHWLLGNALPQREENGATLWHGFITDITSRKRMEQQLRDNETFTVSILNSLTSHIVVLDAQGIIIAVNNAWRQFAEQNGLPEIKNNMLGANYLDVCQLPVTQPNEEEILKIKCGIIAVLDGTEQNFHTEYACHSPTEKRWFHMSVSPLQNAKRGAVISHTNITERKQAEIQLRIAAAVFESQEGMIITDADGYILKTNRAFTHITGYSNAEVIGQNPRLLSSGQHDKAFYAAIWQSVYDTGAWQGEIWNQRKNGETYPEQLTITAVKDTDGVVTHYAATFTDITERKATEAYINHLAFYDSLTQLPNRRLLYERIKHGIELNHRTGSQLAVLMMDLDKFKAVNDTLGHAAGDELLQQVAKRVKDRLREVDMVARLGGDEFVILIENEPVEHYKNVSCVAENIIHTLTQPFTLRQNDEVYIGASIGIAIYPQHGDSVETLMDNADAALYHAKDKGRGCFAYFSEILTP